MEQEKVDMFLMSKQEIFPSNKRIIIRDALLAADDSRWGIVISLGFKSPLAALILSIFLGQFGVDRFYLGQVALGLLKLITCGGCGIWTLIDWFIIMKLTREHNYNKFLPFL